MQYEVCTLILSVCVLDSLASPPMATSGRSVMVRTFARMYTSI